MGRHRRRDPGGHRGHRERDHRRAAAPHPGAADQRGARRLHRDDRQARSSSARLCRRAGRRHGGAERAPAAAGHLHSALDDARRVSRLAVARSRRRHRVRSPADILHAGPGRDRGARPRARDGSRMAGRDHGGVPPQDQHAARRRRHRHVLRRERGAAHPARERPVLGHQHPQRAVHPGEEPLRDPARLQHLRQGDPARARPRRFLRQAEPDDGDRLHAARRDAGADGSRCQAVRPHRHHRLAVRGGPARRGGCREQDGASQRRTLEAGDGVLARGRSRGSSRRPGGERRGTSGHAADRRAQGDGWDGDPPRGRSPSAGAAGAHEPAPHLGGQRAGPGGSATLDPGARLLALRQRLAPAARARRSSGEARTAGIRELRPAAHRTHGVRSARRARGTSRPPAGA